MTDVEGINFSSMQLSEALEPPLQKHTNNNTETVTLQPSSKQMEKSKMSPNLHLELENQDTEDETSSFANKSTMATPSKMHDNQYSVKSETDIGVQLPVQEIDDQYSKNISSSSEALSIAEETPLVKFKNDNTGFESLQSSSQKMVKSNISPILDSEIGNPSRIQETENKIFSIAVTSTMPTPSEMHDNQYPLKLEYEIIVQLPVQEIESQNLPNVSCSSKALSKDEESSSQKHKNITTKYKTLQPSSQFIDKSNIPKILDSKLGNPSKIQETGNKLSSFAAKSTVPTPSTMHDNQYSVKSDTCIIVQSPVQGVKCYNPLHISSSSVVSNIDNVDCKNSSTIEKSSETKIQTKNLQPISRSAVQLPGTSKNSLTISNSEIKNLQPISRSAIQLSGSSKNSSTISSSGTKIQIKNLQPISRSGVKLPGSKSRAELFHLYLASKLKEATKLPAYALESNGSESEINRCLMYLEIMRIIYIWLDQIEKLNENYSKRYNDLIQIITNFNQLQEMVDEKLKFLSMGMSFSNLEIQNKDSEYETSVYESLYKRGRNLLLFLRHHKKYLDAKFMKFSEDRLRYMDGSMHIANYQVEEKLSEKGENLLNEINSLSKLLNNTSVELVESSAFVDFFYLECDKMVKKYFNDIETAFSV